MRELIERYASGADVLQRGIAGLTPAEIDSFPIPGTWSIRQIVLHLTDSELVDADRIKRLIAEDNALLIGYNENRFAARLQYPRRDVAAAAGLFRQLRQATAELLRLVPEEEYGRTAVHSERGTLTLRGMLEYAEAHVENHLRHLREKRRLLGKPMA
ncbi:MAG: DinB family protein [Phycisphaerae bacterium]|nr:DinB family protein [Phycisphaerae bacterium]MCZ2400301.1 DinB family protein [Phycisphaerae bacterium]NUQ50367.1 DinB family protein [Phycisphaerae bacterium]